MARRRKTVNDVPEPLVPATTPEGREQQLTALAMDLVERRLREGTASSAETVHFLKIASTRDKLERAKLEHETRLLDAKSQSIENMEDTRQMMTEALRAMRVYGGDTEPMMEEE